MYKLYSEPGIHYALNKIVVVIYRNTFLRYVSIHFSVAQYLGLGAVTHWHLNQD